MPTPFRLTPRLFTLSLHNKKRSRNRLFSWTLLFLFSCFTNYTIKLINSCENLQSRKVVFSSPLKIRLGPPGVTDGVAQAAMRPAMRRDVHGPWKGEHLVTPHPLHGDTENLHSAQT